MAMVTATPDLIEWGTDVELAQDQAKSTGKLVLLELFSPKCISCQNMEERTFSDSRVARMMEDAFIPVHYDVLANPDIMQKFHAGWTPTLAVRCSNGDDHRRWVGFLPPLSFIGELALGRVQYNLAAKEYDTAHRLAQEAVELTMGDELRHVEALYWQGVSAYKATENQDLLIKAWKDILARFPNSEWAKRVDFANEL